MTLSSNSSLSNRPRFDSVLFWLSSTSLNFFFPPNYLVHPPFSPWSPQPSQYSVPLATVSKAPIPKGWRRGPVMSSMHNCIPVIDVQLSLPLCHCHLFLSFLHLLSCSLSLHKCTFIYTLGHFYVKQ